MAVQPVDELQREIGLGVAGVAFAEERLAMEVADLDIVVVDNGELADPGAGKRRDDCAADSTSSNDGDPRGLELLLADSADLRQHDLARVTVELLVGERHCPVEPKPPAPRLVSPSSATSRKAAFSTGAGTS